MAVVGTAKNARLVVRVDGFEDDDYGWLEGFAVDMRGGKYHVDSFSDNEDIKILRRNPNAQLAVKTHMPYEGQLYTIEVIDNNFKVYLGSSLILSAVDSMFPTAGNWEVTTGELISFENLDAIGNAKNAQVTAYCDDYDNIIYMRDGNYQVRIEYYGNEGELYISRGAVELAYEYYEYLDDHLIVKFIDNRISIFNQDGTVELLSATDSTYALAGDWIPFKGTWGDFINLDTIAVKGVWLNKATTSLAPLATEQLIATVSPADATNKAVTWSSSNPAIATVSATGLVTAVAVGTATITVTTVDGAKKATCFVSVIIGNAKNARVTVNQSSGGAVLYARVNNNGDRYDITTRRATSENNRIQKRVGGNIYTLASEKRPVLADEETIEIVGSKITLGYGLTVNDSDLSDAGDWDLISGTLVSFENLDTPEPTGTNMQLNLGTDFKTVDSIQINIGSTWKDITGASIAIGGAWKTVF